MSDFRRTGKQSSRTARRGALLGLVVLAASNLPAQSDAQESCPGGRDWLLTNGVILTVDAAGSTVDSVRIRGERIIAVGGSFDRGEPCLQVVDLGGRTVIPGLIDSHTHFIRTAQAPGPFISGLEAASSIADLHEALRAAAARAEPGEWIAAIGGFTPNQFAERRMPTRAELSVAVPDNPVYMQIGYSGRGITNDVGRSVLAAAGIDVPADGFVPPGGDALNFVLRSRTDARMHRRFPEYMDYAISLGLTTVVDHACCDWLGAHLADEDRPNMRIVESIWRSGGLPLRLRIQYDHRDIRDQKDIRSVTARLANATYGLGDDMYKAVRLGERVIADAATDDEVFEAYLRAAEAGWALSQHTIREDEIERYIRIMERVAARVPLSQLRWTLEHVFEITPGQIERLLAIGVSVRVQDHDYIRNESTSWNAGPPFRTLLESGIRMGAGSDSGVVGPLNPWLSIYYMVTGRDAGGEVIIPGEQIGRADALRLYTAANAWFNFEEDEFGSIEVGKYADLVVLDRPFLEVPDDEIRQIESLLTMVGGRIVHARAPYARLAP